MELLAQTTTGGSSLTAFLPLVLIFVVFYFLLIRPQRQRAKKQAELVEALQVGDQVQTVGGLFGVIVSIAEDAVVLGLEDGRVRVSRRAIARRITPDEDE
ncbi:MAG TPA: preprotein translocase subunit YajC [Acidimicrobiia bacterium]